MLTTVFPSENSLSEMDDDALGYPDMSNLAVKGIIAISAMDKLAKALEKPNIDSYEVD